MGLLTNILAKAESALTTIQNKVFSPIGSKIASLPVIGNVVSFVEKNPSVVAGGLGTGTVLKGVVTGSFAQSLPKTIIAAATATPKIAAISAATAVVGGSALVTNPEGTISALAKAPSSSVNFLSNVGQFIGDPSIERAKDIVTENPLIASGVAIGAGALALKGTGGLLVASKILGDDEISVSAPSAETNLPTSTGGFTSTIPSDAGKPITPQTQTISAGSTTTKRRRKRTITKQPSINIKIDDRDIYNVSNRKLFKGRRS